MSGNMDNRIAIKAEAKKRVSKLAFASPVTNVCSGEKGRWGYFVRYIPHLHFVECTDGKGWFHDTDADVIYPGHLGSEECATLWAPIWESIYGKEVV